MSRLWTDDGFDHAVNFSPGSLTGLTDGPMSWAVLLFPVSPGFDGIFTARNGTTVNFFAVVDNLPVPVDIFAGFDSGGAQISMANLITAGDYQIIGYSKPSAGSAQCRGHYYNYTAGPPWTHFNGTTAGGGPSGAIDNLRMGLVFGGDRLSARKTVAAVWLTGLSDADFETLPTTLAAWMALAPAECWPMNQANASDPILSITGGGADQISVTGTAPTVSAEEPPGWSYELTASVDLTPAVLTLTAVELEADPGLVTVDLTPAILTLAAPAFDAVPGVVSVTLTPAQIQLVAVPLVEEPEPPEDLMSKMFTAVTAVTECVRLELAATDAGAPERVCLLVPGAIAWDKCDCGQLAATITKFYWSSAWPNQATNPDPRGQCEVPYLVADVRISILRCAPQGLVRGEPPTCDQLLAAARVWDDDAQAVRNGVGCCLTAMKRNDPELFEFALREQTSVGPQGACVGSELNLSIGIASALCCP